MPSHVFIHSFIQSFIISNIKERRNSNNNNNNNNNNSSKSTVNSNTCTSCMFKKEWEEVHTYLIPTLLPISIELLIQLPNIFSVYSFMQKAFISNSLVINDNKRYQSLNNYQLPLSYNRYKSITKICNICI